MRCCECGLVEHLDGGRAAVFAVEVVLLAVRHVYAVGDVPLGGAVEVLPVERHEERGREEHEREEEAAEEHAVPGDPQQRVVDDGAARGVPAEVRVLDELDRRDEVHGTARVRLDLVAERGVVLHVGVELRARALLHEPLLVLAALLLGDERLGVQLHARDDEAEAPQGEREQRDVAERVRDESRVSARPEHAGTLSVTNMRATDFRNQRFFWNSINDAEIAGMPRGRSRSGRPETPNVVPQTRSGHHGGAKTPRGTSAMSNASRKTVHPHKQQTLQPQQQHAHGKSKKANGNAEKTLHLSPDILEKIAQLVRDGGADRNPIEPINKRNMPNAINDTPYKKEDQLQKAASRLWSNYPIPLPPQLDTLSVYGVRSALLNANDKELLNYYSPATDDKTIGSDWELGVLECYDGITEFDQGNFLSCDFVNPKYLAQKTKQAGLSKELRDLQPPQELKSVWLKNRSCFVYAPADTILSTVDTDTKSRKTMPMTEAVDNWKTYASVAIEDTESRRSPGVKPQTASLLAKFWFYHEEFVEFENKDKLRNGAALKEKGRIGMLFPIKPMDPDTHNVLNILNVPEDSIGFGQVCRIGERLPELDSTQTIPSWNELQKHIGRYILLTSLWSSSKSDSYEVCVAPDALKGIYNRVSEMTRGDMIVNVRRGVDAYGRLCVVQKQIVLDPMDASFGIADKSEQEKPKISVYVTQIFTCVKPQSAYDPAGNRQKITAAYTKHNTMSDEEKNLSNMFQMSNNKIIQCLKNEQYRDVMQAFWKADRNNMSDILKETVKETGENKWCMNSMKAMLIGMLLTTYKVMFQRLPTKAACPERTERFMNIMKNYRVWFSNSKCFASDEFLLQYESDMKAKELKADQFTGMPPSAYIANAAQEDKDDAWNKNTPPEIMSNDDVQNSLNVRAKTEKHSASTSEIERLKDVAEAQRLQKAQQEYETEKQRIRNEGGDSPKGPADNELRERYGLAPKQEARFGAEESFSERLAKLQNW